MSTAVIEEPAQLLEQAEFGRLAGLSYWSVVAHVRRGNIKAVHLGRLVRIPRSELLRVQEQGLPKLSRPDSQAEEVEA